jgi:hypothetical protein
MKIRDDGISRCFTLVGEFETPVFETPTRTLNTPDLGAPSHSTKNYDMQYVDENTSLIVKTEVAPEKLHAEKGGILWNNGYEFLGADEDGTQYWRQEHDFDLNSLHIYHPKAGSEEFSEYFLTREVESLKSIFTTNKSD